MTAIVASDMDGTLTTAETWRGVHAWILAHRPSAAARRFVPLRLPAVLVDVTEADGLGTTECTERGLVTKARRDAKSADKPAK